MVFLGKFLAYLNGKPLFILANFLGFSLDAVESLLPLKLGDRSSLQDYYSDCPCLTLIVSKYIQSTLHTILWHNFFF